MYTRIGSEKGRCARGHGHAGHLQYIWSRKKNEFWPYVHQKTYIPISFCTITIMRSKNFQPVSNGPNHRPPKIRCASFSSQFSDEQHENPQYSAVPIYRSTTKRPVRERKPSKLNGQEAMSSEFVELVANYDRCDKQKHRNKPLQTTCSDNAMQRH